MSSEDILYVRPEKVNLRNEIGSPFVIISKNPVEDPHNPKGSDLILLKTEDGTLLSLRESWAEGQNGENTGLVIELFDPDHLFLMQFIDNNSVKAFKRSVGSDEGANRFGEAYALLDTIIEEKKFINEKLNQNSANIPFSEFGYEDLGITETHRTIEARRAQDAKSKEEFATIAEARLGEIDASANAIRKNAQFPNDIYYYITYGYGKDNISSSRRFTFSKLEFLHDSGKQGGVRLEFTHNQSHNLGVSLDRKLGDYTGYQKNQIHHIGNAHIAKIKYTDTQPSIMELDETADIANLMEYTLQHFMREQSPSDHTPLVFLSPEVTPKILEIIESATNLDPVKDVVLARQGQADATLLINSRMLSLKKLLESFGFEVKSDPGAVSTTKVDSIVASNAATLRTGASNLEEKSTFTIDYFLKIKINEESSAAFQVTKIIRNIYNKLGITAGSEIVNENMINPEHLKYFYDKFLEGETFDTLRSSILTTKNGEEYTNVDYIRTFDHFYEGLKPIHLIGDGLFIKGVLYRLPYKENEKIQDLYTKTATEGSNIERFIKNFTYPSYLELIKRIFVDPVRKAGRFTTSDEYAAKLPNQVFNKLTESVPSFLANTDNANVISFVATHNGHEYAELLNTVDLSFRHTFFKVIKDGNVEKTLKAKKKLSEEQIEVLLEDMLSYEFLNSGVLAPLIEYMNEGFDSKNSDTAKAYRKVLDTFLKKLENSPLYKDHDVSEDAVRSYMMYMQKLALRVSAVKVKSVPMFVIAPDFWINKPCLFLNKKLFTPNSTFQLNRESPFSGMYEILGLEHVISGSECFSSFSLSKVPIATGEIAKSAPGK